MYIDKELEFSLEQVVTSSAASTNYVDLTNARDIGMSPKYIAVTVNESATAVGAATVNFQLQKDDNSSFSTATTVYDSGAISKDTLVAGYQFFIPIPPGTDERYLRMYYSVGTGPLTAGKFTAQVVDSIQKSKAYPDAL